MEGHEEFGLVTDKELVELVNTAIELEERELRMITEMGEIKRMQKETKKRICDAILDDYGLYNGRVVVRTRDGDLRLVEVQGERGEKYLYLHQTVEVERE